MNPTLLNLCLSGPTLGTTSQPPGGVRFGQIWNHKNSSVELLSMCCPPLDRSHKGHICLCCMKTYIIYIYICIYIYMKIYSNISEMYKDIQYKYKIPSDKRVRGPWLGPDRLLVGIFCRNESI